MRITRAVELMESETDLDLHCVKGQITEHYKAKPFRDEIQEDFQILIDGQKFKLRFSNSADYGSKFEGQDLRGKFVVVSATPSAKNANQLCGLKWKIDKGGYKCIRCSYKAVMEVIGEQASVPAQQPETAPAQQQPAQQTQAQRAIQQHQEQQATAQHSGQQPTSAPAPPQPASHPVPNHINEAKRIGNQIANTHRLATYKTNLLMGEYQARFGLSLPPTEIHSMIASIFIEMNRKGVSSMMPEAGNVLDLICGEISG